MGETTEKIDQINALKRKFRLWNLISYQCSYPEHLKKLIEVNGCMSDTQEFYDYKHKEYEKFVQDVIEYIMQETNLRADQARLLWNHAYEVYKYCDGLLDPIDLLQDSIKTWNSILQSMSEDY